MTESFDAGEATAQAASMAELLSGMFEDALDQFFGDVSDASALFG